MPPPPAPPNASTTLSALFFSPFFLSFLLLFVNIVAVIFIALTLVGVADAAARLRLLPPSLARSLARSRFFSDTRAGANPAARRAHPRRSRQSPRRRAAPDLRFPP